MRELECVTSPISRDSSHRDHRVKWLRLLQQRCNANIQIRSDKLLLLLASPPIFVSGSSEVPNSA